MNNKNTILKTIFIASFLILFGGSLISCRSSAETPIQMLETATVPPQTTFSDSTVENPVVSTSSPETPTPEPADIQAAWQSSPHADSFVLDENGQNNTCARCHAPINWMPTMDDLPESCFTCKFELEPPPPTIAKVDWTNIPCNICHKLDKKDNILPEYAWLEIAPLGEYAPVASTTELCMKCHATEGIPGHGTIQLAAAHADYQCTNCHPAHETTTSCNIQGCHPTLDNASVLITGHDQDHQSVTCVACHDGSDMVVGPSEKTGLWTTFMSDPADGNTGLFAFTSHNIVLEAKCDRCHFSDNPWGLSVVGNQ